MRRALLPAVVALLALTAPLTRAAVPDYGGFDGVLLRSVRHGFVDYDDLKADPAFDRFVKAVGETDLADLDDRDARLAFLINSYNALAIRGILDGYSPATLLGRQTYLKRREYQVLGQPITLENLEHTQLLPLGEPRVHFAIVCASISCPRLSNRAYVPATLAVQLDAAARAFVNDGTRNRFDPERRIAFLSKIFEWYGADFEKAAGSVQRYLAGYVRDPSVAALLQKDGFEIHYLDYDWDLNGVYRAAAD